MSVALVLLTLAVLAVPRTSAAVIRLQILADTAPAGGGNRLERLLAGAPRLAVLGGAGAGASAGAGLAAVVGPPTRTGLVSASPGRVLPALVVGTSCALLGGMASWFAVSAARSRLVDRMLAGMVDAVAGLAAELRAGQSPAAALEAAVRCSRDPVIAGVFEEAATTAGAGGSVAPIFRCWPPGAASAGATSVWHSLQAVAAGWSVSERTGAALGTVLDRVEHDLREVLRRRRVTATHLAGPRATAVLLAVLPVVGIALGSAMGSHPLSVLLSTSFGLVCLLAGALLEVVGAVWTAWLVRSAARPS